MGTDLQKSLDSIPADDLFGLCLADLVHTPLLTAEEERKLSCLIREGRVAWQCLAQDGHDPEADALLRAQVEQGQVAREQLCLANTRLVISITRRYYNQGLPTLDLVQEGLIGLLQAVDRFDPKRGTRFSTFATWWIRQGITRALANQARTIRIPVHMHDHFRRIRRATRELEQHLGRSPTLEEVATALDTQPAWVRQVIRSLAWPISLEQPLQTEEDSVAQVNLISDKLALDPSEHTERHLLLEKIEQAMLVQLTPREARIVCLRYGLNGCPTCNLSEIGRKFGLSRERIRQLEAQAMDKLRQFFNAS